jgi:hypothetical protein
MGKGKPRHTETYVRLTTSYGTSRVMTLDRATRLASQFPTGGWANATSEPATYDEWLAD